MLTSNCVTAATSYSLTSIQSRERVRSLLPSFKVYTGKTLRSRFWVESFDITFVLFNYFVMIKHRIVWKNRGQVPTLPNISRILCIQSNDSNETHCGKGNLEPTTPVPYTSDTHTHTHTHTHMVWDNTRSQEAVVISIKSQPPFPLTIQTAVE
jgi:hypothetical protein